MDKKQACRGVIYNIKTMRNILIIVSLFILANISAQNVNSLLRKGGSFKGLGKQGDTLVTSQTIDYTLELSDEVFGVMSLAIETDSISGTAAYSSIVQESLNGLNWTDIDTVTHSGGGDNYGKFDAINATQTYYRIRTTATSGTQKNQLKIWGRLNEGFVIQD